MFERGTLKKTDNSTIQLFSEEAPLIGLQGWENATAINSLGFITYKCPAPFNN